MGKNKIMVLKKNFLEDEYNNLKEQIYLSTNIVNIKKALAREEELFSLGEYLPNLLREILHPNYYSRMEQMGVLDEVLDTMAQTRKQGREADTIEFINWIDTHKDFEELLNEENVIKLADKIEPLEMEYEALKNG